MKTLIKIAVLLLIPFLATGQIIYKPDSGEVSDTTIIRPESFGAVADFRQDIAVYVAGDNTVTCATCNFTQADVGDYVALKSATTNASYSNKRIALNTTIASITNSTTIELVDAPTESGTDIMNWGKNNVTNLIAMFEYCNQNNIRTVSFSGGTYGYSFKDETFSTLNNNRVGALNGILQKGSITILGNGSTIKDMWEDQQLSDITQEKKYATLLLAGNGTRRFYNLTLESPDRTNTRNSHDNLFGIRTEETPGIQIDVWGENFNIISGSGDPTKGYSHAIYSSGGGTWDSENDIIEDWSEWHLDNCTFESNVQVITYFTNSSDGPARKLHLTDVQTKGGVSVTSGTLTNAVSISSGSDQLTLTNDTLSFYDLRDITGTTVTIDGSFTATVASVDSWNTITLSANSPSSFTNVDLEYSTGVNGKFGHIMYVHPNLSLDFDNITSINAGSTGGFALHYFSGGGQLGRTRYFYLNNWSKKSITGQEMTLDLNSPNLSYNQFDSLKAKISNMPVKLQTGASPKMVFDNSFFIPNVILYDTAYIENSKGILRFTGDNQFSVYNHEGTLTIDDPQPTVVAVGCTSYLNLSGGGNVTFQGGTLSGVRVPSTATDLESCLILNSTSDKNSITRTIEGTTDDTNELVKRLKFINTDVGGKELTTWNGQVITGLIPFQNAVENTEITTLKSIVETPAFQIQSNYSIDYNYLVLGYDADNFSINFNNYADVIFVNELGNTNLWKAFSTSTSFFTGIVSLNPTGSNVELRTGGNIRLKNTGVRSQTSRFKLIPESLVFVELDNNRYTSTSIPTRSNAVNNEIVYNIDQTSNTKSWSYIIETTEVVAEAFTPASTTLPYTFTLANIPYRKEREQTFINPNFEITVPRTGGNDILTLGVWGELYNQNGTNVGSLNIETGEITIRTLSTGVLTLADVIVDYEYISSESWVATTNSGGESTQVANLAELSTSDFAIGTEVVVSSTGARYKIQDTAPANYNSGVADGIFVVSDGGADTDFAVYQPRSGKVIINELVTPYLVSSATFSTTAASTTVTCSGCNFTADNVGDYLQVNTAGRRDIAIADHDGDELITDIVSVTNSTTVEVRQAAFVTRTNVQGYHGSDYTTLVNRIIAADYKYIVFDGGQWVFKDRTNGTADASSAILVNQKDNVTIEGINWPELNFVSSNPNTYLGTGVETGRFKMNLVTVIESDNFTFNDFIVRNIGQSEARTNTAFEAGYYTELNNVAVTYDRNNDKRSNTGHVIQVRGLCEGGTISRVRSYKVGGLIESIAGANYLLAPTDFTIQDCYSENNPTGIIAGNNWSILNSDFTHKDLPLINQSNRDADLGATHAIYFSTSGQTGGKVIGCDFDRIVGTVIHINTTQNIQDLDRVFTITNNTFTNGNEPLSVYGNSRNIVDFIGNHTINSKSLLISSENSVVTIKNNIINGPNRLITVQGTSNIESANGILPVEFDSLYVLNNEFYNFDVSSVFGAVRMQRTGNSPQNFYMYRNTVDETNSNALVVTGSVPFDNDFKVQFNTFRSGMNIHQIGSAVTQDATNYEISDNYIGIVGGSSIFVLRYPITFERNTVEKLTNANSYIFQGQFFANPASPMVFRQNTWINNTGNRLFFNFGQNDAQADIQWLDNVFQTNMNRSQNPFFANWKFATTGVSGSVDFVEDLLPLAGKDGFNRIYYADQDPIFLIGKANTDIVVSLQANKLVSDYTEITTDFSITAANTTLSCPSCSFNNLDVGKTISVFEANTSGDELITTIASVTDANTVELTAAAVETVSNVSGFYATDNSSILTPYLVNNSNVVIPKGNYYFGSEIQLSNVVNLSIDINEANLYRSTWGQSTWGEGYNDGLIETDFIECANCKSITLKNGDVYWAGQSTAAVSDFASYAGDFTTSVVTPGTQVTVTSAGGNFSAGDVNKIIRLETGGTNYWYFYISEFTDANTIQIRDGGGFDNPSLSSFGSTTLTNVDGSIFTEDGYYATPIGGISYSRQGNKRGNNGALLKATGTTSLITIDNVKTHSLGSMFLLEGANVSDIRITNSEVDNYGSVAIYPGLRTLVSNCYIHNELAAPISSVDQAQNLGSSHASYITQSYAQTVHDKNVFEYIRGVAIQFNTGATTASLGHILTNNYMYESQRAGTVQGSASWNITFNNNIWENCGGWSFASTNSTINISNETWKGFSTDQNDYPYAYSLNQIGDCTIKNSTFDGKYTGSGDVSAIAIVGRTRGNKMYIHNNIFTNNTFDLQVTTNNLGYSNADAILDIANNTFDGTVWLPKRPDIGALSTADLSSYLVFRHNTILQGGLLNLDFPATVVKNTFIPDAGVIPVNIDLISDSPFPGQGTLNFSNNEFIRPLNGSTDLVVFETGSPARTIFNFNTGIDNKLSLVGTEQFLQERNLETPIYESVSSATDVVPGTYYTTDSSGGAFTLTILTGWRIGQSFTVSDLASSAGTNFVTVDFNTNGYTVHGQNTAVLNTDDASFKFIYVGNNEFVKERL